MISGPYNVRVDIVVEGPGQNGHDSVNVVLKFFSAVLGSLDGLAKLSVCVSKGVLFAIGRAEDTAVLDVCDATFKLVEDDDRSGVGPDVCIVGLI